MTFIDTITCEELPYADTRELLKLLNEEEEDA